MDSAPQHSFGKYLILERIASGGMAEIYKARLDGIGGFHRFFAIKRVRPDLSQDKDYVDLLVEEAKIAGLLSHANIVQILDLGKIHDLYYVAMEYVDGRDLGSILKRCKEKGITVPVPHAVFIAIEMLKGLEYAHQRQILRGGRPVPLNIIHRDVSPSNILVSFQGEVKLTDFGMARAKVRAAQTLSGKQKDRFDYCSPEQAAGDSIDQRSDLFSASVVLYEMLCGVHPFKKQGDIQTIEAIKIADYQVPSYVNPDVPYALEQVLARALSKDPKERFATAAELKSELDGFFHESGFIFSHSTLAAFLKGLFPELNAPRKGKKETSADQETVAFNAQQFSVAGDDTEAPTSLSTSAGLAVGTDIPDFSASTGAEELETLFRGMPDSTGTGSFGPTPGPTDDATLIRRRPQSTNEDDWSDDQRTQVHPGARQNTTEKELDVDMEAETRDGVFKIASGFPDRFSSDEESPSEPSAPDPMILGESLQTQETKTTTPELQRARTDDFPQPPVAPQLLRPDMPSTDELPFQSAKKATSQQTSTRTLLMIVLIGTICLIVGIAAGFLLGVQTSGPPEITQNPVPRTPPVLRITGPEGTVLTVGDRDLTLDESGVTSINLPEDEPTTVKATLEGHAPIERLYTLQGNAELNLTLEWVKLRKRE